MVRLSSTGGALAIPGLGSLARVRATSDGGAWMIAFQGDGAVAMFVELGEYGTVTAGPLLE